MKQNDKGVDLDRDNGDPFPYQTEVDMPVAFEGGKAGWHLCRTERAFNP